MRSSFFSPCRHMRIGCLAVSRNWILNATVIKDTHIPWLKGPEESRARLCPPEAAARARDAPACMRKCRSTLHCHSSRSHSVVNFPLAFGRFSLRSTGSIENAKIEIRAHIFVSWRNRFKKSGQRERERGGKAREREQEKRRYERN